jgi:hypothetical protein
VDFTLTQTIGAPRSEVLKALGDHGYYEFLSTKVTTIEQPELLDVTVRDGIVEMKVRYAFAGEISGPAKMLIDASKLTWVIHTRLDLSTHQATLEIIPDHYADLVVADAELRYEDHGQETLETFEGSLEVKIPLMASAAEKVIVEGLLKHLRAEADALGDFCAQGGRTNGIA